MLTAIGGGIVGGLVAMAAPSILSGIVGVIRPLVKEVVKGGIVVCSTVTDMVGEVGEQCSDLVAEAQTETQGDQSKPSQPKKGSAG
jgi:hypothetical protein